MKASTALAITRIGKGVSLLGFFLPWLTVSCAGQPVMTVSGLGLATGTFDLHNPFNGAVQHVTGHPVPLIAFAALLIVAGLVLSFIHAKKEIQAGVLMASSILAAVLAVVGQFSVYDSAHKQPAPGSDLAAQLGALGDQSFQMTNRYGLFVVLGALGVCMVCSLWAFQIAFDEPEDEQKPGAASQSVTT